MLARVGLQQGQGGRDRVDAGLSAGEIAGEDLDRRARNRRSNRGDGLGEMSGATVIEPRPSPDETSATARLRCSVNQRMVVEVMGA